MSRTGRMVGILTSLLALHTVVPAQTPVEYAYVPVDVPFEGAHDTRVTDVNTQLAMVGTYTDQQGHTWGWVFNPKQAKFTALKHRLCHNVHVTSINKSGQIAGTCGHIKGGHDRAFVRRGTNWTFFLVPGAVASRALAVSDNGFVAGSYGGPGSWFEQGWIYSLRTKQFELLGFAPKSLGTVITGITNTGDLGGYVHDGGTSQGWTEFDGVVNPYFHPDPSQQSSQVLDVGTGRSLVGMYWNHVGGNSYIDRLGVVTNLAMPGAVATTVEGFAENGVVVGSYLDEESYFHGFMAMPQSPVSAVMEQAVGKGMVSAFAVDTGN
jgi:hypothetical protein